MDASMEYRRRTLSLPRNTEESKIIIKKPKMGDINKSVSLVDVFDEEMWERCMSDCRFKRFHGDTHSYEVEEVLRSLDGRDMVGIEDIYRLFEDEPMTEDKNGKVKHSEQHFEEDPVLDKEVAVITKERTKNILCSLFVKAKAWEPSGNSNDEVGTRIGTPSKRKISSPENGTPIARRYKESPMDLGSPRTPISMFLLALWVNKRN